MEITHNLKLSLVCALFILGCQTSVICQKLPDVRVDQETVTEESLFIEATRQRILGNFDVAETNLKEAIKKYGKKAVFYFELAKVYEEVGNIPKAIETNLLALNIEPDNEWYWEYQAKLNIQLEDDAATITAYTKLSELFPDRHYYLENVAFHQLRNDDPNGALKTLNQIESKAGINYETTRQKHLIYDEMGKTKDAAAELDVFLDQYPRDASMAIKAASYALNNDDKKRAIDYYESILIYQPNNAVAKGALLKLANGGDTQASQLNDFIEDRNVSLDEKILQLIPIILDIQDGKTDFNIAQLETLSNSLITQYGESDKTLALSGDIFSIQNKLEPAAEQYINSIEYSDGNYLVWEQLLYVLTDLKDGKRLKFYAAEAVDLYPNKPLPIGFLAISYAFNNQLDEASKYIRQAKLISGKNETLKTQVEGLEHLIRQLKG